ncbi:MAG: penicillin acylase family protein [Ignavibacteriales bacterium]|nr:penicillin acylase family protein [Ignavibacteriales bacterium]
MLIVSGIIFYNILNSSLPEYEGEITNSEISADVQIYRDSMAIPYIIAKTEEDAAFALGLCSRARPIVCNGYYKARR